MCAFLRNLLLKDCSELPLYINLLHNAVLQCGTASLVLRDQDHTNKREGDWVRINTLGSYNVDEMVRVPVYVCVSVAVYMLVK